MKIVVFVVALTLLALAGAYFNYTIIKAACKNCPVKRQCDKSIECGEKALCEDEE